MMKNTTRLPVFLVLGLLLLANCRDTEVPEESASPRTIVTTDGEIDDVDSFIRRLLYANEFTIEGLVYELTNPFLC